MTTLSAHADRGEDEPRLAGSQRFADGLAAAVIVTCPAEVDFTNVPQLSEALLTACRSNPVVVVDMSETGFCDSSGVRALVHAHQLARASGGELRAVVASPVLMRILAVMGVDRLFRIFASLAEALATASESAPESWACHASNLPG